MEDLVNRSRQLWKTWKASDCTEFDNSVQDIKQEIFSLSPEENKDGEYKKYYDEILYLSRLFHRRFPEENKIRFCFWLDVKKKDEMQEWDPDNYPAGGEEEKLVRYSSYLASLGHCVVVLANPPSKSRWSLRFSNPLYLSCHLYGHRWYDFTICWKHTYFEHAKVRSKMIAYYDDEEDDYIPFPVGSMKMMIFDKEKSRELFQNELPDIPTAMLKGNFEKQLMKEYEKFICENK